jgi:hypothetical protein
LTAGGFGDALTGLLAGAGSATLPGGSGETELVSEAFWLEGDEGKGIHFLTWLTRFIACPFISDDTHTDSSIKIQFAFRRRFFRGFSGDAVGRAVGSLWSPWGEWRHGPSIERYRMG